MIARTGNPVRTSRRTPTQRHVGSVAGVLLLSIVTLAMTSAVGVAQSPETTPGTVQSPGAAESTNGEPTIGVQLLRDPKRVTFGSSTGRFRLEAPDRDKSKKIVPGKTATQIVPLATMSVEYRKKGDGRWIFAVAPELAKKSKSGPRGYQFYDGQQFRVRADGAPYTEVGGRRYEGWIEFTWIPDAEGTGSWRMVNRLPMERYLAGVLAGEMTSAEPAALQAQAIAARTFALYQMLTRSPGARIHVDASIRSQKYVGGKQDSAILDAVQSTRGEVLFHQGRLFKSQYHSTCGGHTAGGSATFGTPNIKTLTSVRCTYCRNERFTKKGWSCSIPEKEIRNVIKRVAAAPPYNIALGRISKIEPVDKQKGGHATYVKITHSGGHFELDATEFRNRLLFDGGFRDLRSTSFAITKQGDAFHFTGHGFGHGVGMCQRGAMRAAVEGLDAIQILKFYYRGADVVQLW